MEDCEALWEARFRKARHLNDTSVYAQDTFTPFLPIFSRLIYLNIWSPADATFWDGCRWELLPGAVLGGQPSFDSDSRWALFLVTGVLWEGATISSSHHGPTHSSCTLSFYDGLQAMAFSQSKLLLPCIAFVKDLVLATRTITTTSNGEMWKIEPIFLSISIYLYLPLVLIFP